MSTPNTTAPAVDLPRLVSVWIAADPDFLEPQKIPEMVSMFFAERPSLYQDRFWQVSGKDDRNPIPNVWRLKPGEVVTAQINANETSPSTGATE